MQTVRADVVVIGAGGGGLRAAIAVAQSDPTLEIALVSKVYPMRSHTVAAEGGCAGVVQDHDSVEYHFADTVSGGDWLCDQDVVEYFVKHATEENLRLEHWGCPWSRRADGSVNVRAFGGMKIERTWFAADKTGFHILHTLFQTSLRFPQIKRYDEYFCTDLLMHEGRCTGVQAIDIKNGSYAQILGKAVILATGGAGRVYRYNTNGGIVTGDGMAMAYRQGAALQDMEFVQYHPTGLPGSGILMTEGCRGEGGILTNTDGYRYLQDYELGPETPLGQPKNKYMELGPRDRLSQAFWHEEQKGRVIDTPRGTAVNLDLRHLGEQKINERLPFIRELAKSYVGVDPVNEPIPVRPTAHYTMGGIATDIHTQTSIPGLYAVGECASVGLHGANRLGSNSLAELSVFGKVAGEQAADFAKQNTAVDTAQIAEQVKHNCARWDALRTAKGSEKIADIRNAMAAAMESGVGIFRTRDGVQNTADVLAQLQARMEKLDMSASHYAFNTEWLVAIELGFMLDVAEAMTASAAARNECRGSHQRLDGCLKRDDVNFLKHTQAFYSRGAAPTLRYQDVVITTSPPAARAYGDAQKVSQNQGESA
ncbi:MAG: fumarate reductase (quinol) flavoprotein subunit [Gammaproteobacteria bacterium]|nr:MAG: fumarate reductase (quinol) flavoprotein subunit [Gammaproteobacteria bacterium]